MNNDREAEILYLAHQLWEESGEPGMTPQTCWKQAALQVMARAPRSSERASGATGTARHQRYAQSGTVVCIDLGTAPTSRCATFIRRRDHSRAANLPLRLVRRRAD